MGKTKTVNIRVQRIRFWVNPWKKIVFPLTRMERKKKRQNHDDSALSSQGGIVMIYLYAAIWKCKNRARLTFFFKKWNLFKYQSGSLI